MKIYLLFTLCCIQCIYLTKGEFDDCQTRESCTDCISSGPKCSWCEDIYYKSGEKSYFKKCDLVLTHEAQGCSNISNPKSSSTIEKSEPLGGDTRVSPKSIKVKLRPGQPTTVDVKVKTPKNFPVDLYYLMDLSLSMKDDLEQIKGLGEILSKEMLNVTSNFRLGFGAFVDKPIGPYTTTEPQEIKTLLAQNDAQYTFAYNNYLPLNEDTTQFAKTLEKVQISFNNDKPESSLEALMQVIVCDREIGWRDKNKARRIVIITTDANFHFAGDGLLGGVVRPNNGVCQLVNNNYTAWNKYDYPSLSQIRAIVVENQITPIFAITGNIELYKQVAEFFGAGSGAVADVLNEDSTNVVPLIKDAYEKIAKVVNIDADVPDGIAVSYTTFCGESKAPQNTAFCDDVAIGETVTFQVELTALDCSLAKTNPFFQIKTSFDNVNVTLELLCDCPCAKEDAPIVIDSPDCTSRGNLSCGQCQCDPVLYAGRFCDCTVEEAKNQTLCRLNSVDDTICGGKGICECGECRCFPSQENDFGELEYIYGDQCQCSNTSCGRSNNAQLCGGPERGRCNCSECICTPEWQGETCSEECIQSTLACIDTEGIECSGQGQCKCNKCQCLPGYIGDLCQECVANCPDPCQDYRECVRCRVLKTSDLTDAQCEFECAKWNITSHIVKDKIPEEEKRCIARDEDDCSFVFTYNKDNVTEEVQLIVQKERICPAEPDILAIILGVIAGIIGIGLALLLIWKLLATIQDRRDFAKFEKDRQNPKWDSGENPIYKEAISTFQNPTYGNKET